MGRRRSVGVGTVNRKRGMYRGRRLGIRMLLVVASITACTTASDVEAAPDTHAASGEWVGVAFLSFLDDVPWTSAPALGRSSAADEGLYELVLTAVQPFEVEIASDSYVWGNRLVGVGEPVVRRLGKGDEVVLLFELPVTALADSQSTGVVRFTIRLGDGTSYEVELRLYFSAGTITAEGEGAVFCQRAIPVVHRRLPSEADLRPLIDEALSIGQESIADEAESFLREFRAFQSGGTGYTTHHLAEVVGAFCGVDLGGAGGGS